MKRGSYLWRGFLSSVQLIAILLVFGSVSLTPVWGSHSTPGANPMVDEILSNEGSNLFEPISLRPKDFRLRWVGPEGTQVLFRLAKRIEWVRVRDILKLPRGILLIEVAQIESGVVTYFGRNQVFSIRRGKGHARIPIALLSGEDYGVHVEFVQRGKKIRGRIDVEYSPTESDSSGKAGALRFDASCTGTFKSLENRKLPGKGWGYVGCRSFPVEGDGFRVVSKEATLYWDGAGRTISVNGSQVASTVPSVWVFRLRPLPRELKISRGDGTSGRDALKLRYFVPKRFRAAFLGLGIGPYLYNVSGGEVTVDTVAPILTLYGSYYLSEGVRLVVFDATSMHSTFYTDFGLYLMTRSFRILDDRLTMNLLLGAHSLVFRYADETYFRFSAPQGIEFVFSDFLKKGYRFSGGAFVYPDLGGRAYYNAWVRWGTSGLFGEINYIAWRESVGDFTVDSRSLGVTVGFPIARFF